METCPCHSSLHLITMVRRSLCGPIACWILAQTSSFVTWSLYEMARAVSSVKPHFHGSYFSLQLCCECPQFTSIQEDGYDQGSTSVIFEVREKLLSFQTGFNFVNAAVICAILETISGCKQCSRILGSLAGPGSSDTTEPRCFKLMTVSFTLTSMLMLLVLFVINLVFSALISMPQAVKALLSCLTNLASSSSLAKPLMSSAK